MDGSEGRQLLKAASRVSCKEQVPEGIVGHGGAGEPCNLLWLCEFRGVASERSRVMKQECRTSRSTHPQRQQPRPIDLLHLQLGRSSELMSEEPHFLNEASTWCNAWVSLCVPLLLFLLRLTIFMHDQRGETQTHTLERLPLLPTRVITVIPCSF